MAKIENDLKPSDEEVQEAIETVEKQMIGSVANIPPGLFVQFPNILRCLQELQLIRKKWTGI